ncbi:MAG: phosphodiesterase [Synergistaceae bacterium]|nr:phosphodiesterase [Synergistaceae bacterium]
MNIMIASDIHGSSDCCRKMIEAFGRERSDRILLLGDILGDGPRKKLAGKYDSDDVADMLNGIAGSVLCVRGNCDDEFTQRELDFPVMAEYCLLYIGGHVVFASHGNRYNMRNLPPLNRGDILLHGHTHTPAWERFGRDNIYVNPGSVSSPRGGSKCGYMVMKDDVMLWKHLDGETYHTERM